MRNERKIERINIEFYLEKDSPLKYKSADTTLSEDEKIQVCAQPNQIIIRGILYVKESSEAYKKDGKNILKIPYLKTNKIL